MTTTTHPSPAHPVASRTVAGDIDSVPSIADEPIECAHEPSHLTEPDDALDSHTPLTTRADLDRRVRQLIPCAVQRQLWLILLDENDVQMPVMIPIGDLPLCAEARDPDAEGLVEVLASLHREFAVGSFVFVFERTGSQLLDDDDCDWLLHLLDCGENSSVAVRGVYLCHDDGLSGYDEDDRDELSRRRHHDVSASSFDM